MAKKLFSPVTKADANDVCSDDLVIAALTRVETKLGRVEAKLDLLFAKGDASVKPQDGKVYPEEGDKKLIESLSGMEKYLLEKGDYTVEELRRQRKEDRGWHD